MRPSRNLHLLSITFVIPLLPANLSHASVECQLTEDALITLTNVPAASFAPGNDLVLSSDAEYAVIGDEEDNQVAQSAGAAYVFRRAGNQWNLQQKLVASDGALGDRFGISMAISEFGDTLIIGSYLDDDLGSNSGSVYVFVRNGTTWSLQQKLRSPDGAADDTFGSSVALSANGGLAVIGASGDDSPGANGAGAAYVFSRTGTNWTFHTKIVQNLPSANDKFGNAVSLSADGTTVAIGAVEDDQGGQQSGAVFVYRRVGGPGTWVAGGTLLPQSAFALFGFSVALSADGNTIAAGAITEEPQPNRFGVVYVFGHNGSTWAQQARIIEPLAHIESPFGLSVGISADGTRAAASVVNSPGFGRIYSRNGTAWSLSTTLLASDPTEINFYGNRIAMSADGQVALVQAGMGITQFSGYFHFLETCPALPGDIDDNGELNLDDAAALVAVLMDAPIAPEHVDRADLNQDGQQDGADIQPFVGFLLAP